MKGQHREAQDDWGKVFKLIRSRQEFIKLGCDGYELESNLKYRKEEKTVPITKKQQIVVPKIEIVDKIASIKHVTKVEPNYHRIFLKLTLPKSKNYEMTEVDYKFLEGHSHLFIYHKKKLLNEQLLCKSIIELELRAGKNPILPKQHIWMVEFLNREYAQLSSFQHHDQLAKIVYNYWKSRRQELKFPLLRVLWKPNPSQISHFLAFRSREKEKRSLRRTTYRLPEEEILDELEGEFKLSLKIFQRIKMRQETKRKLVHYFINAFHSEWKLYFGRSEFLPSFSSTVRVKNKEALRKLDAEVEQMKKQQIEEEQIELEQDQNQDYDEKMSIIEFISTVVYHAEAKGISYDKIFSEKYKEDTEVPKPSKPFTKKIKGQKPQQQNPQNLVKDENTSTECHQLYLLEHKGTVYRTLEPVEPFYEIEQIKPENYLDFKREQIRNYYFANDDDGDFKDLKRNIQQNFKKFLQCKPNKPN